MRYKVINKNSGEDITNNRSWLIRPDGSLYYMEYDLHGDRNAEAVQLPEARWMHHKSTPGGIHDTYKCDNCGFEAGWTTTFCSSCGALMEDKPVYGRK